MWSRIKRVWVSLVLLSCLTGVGCNMVSGENGAVPPLTDAQQELVQELDQHLIPLNETPLLLSDNDLSFLEPFKNAWIIGMGEATHGTREFFQMKHRIFRYLVEHAQHKAIAFEADFSESLYIQNYITGDSSDLDTLMKNVMHFWTWKTEEVKELLEWLRTTNLNRPEADKILYFGFDCQATTYQPVLLESYLTRTLPALWQNMSPLLLEVQALSIPNYQTMPVSRFHAITRQLKAFQQRLRTHKNQLIALSSLSEYELYVQVLRTVVQAFTLRYHLETGHGNYSRDRFMAENVLWIADHVGKEARITLWAHNGHIANDPDYNGSGSMGYILHQKLADMYQSVGFALSKGSFTAMSQDDKGHYQGVATHDIVLEPDPHSFNFLCHAASHANFVFEPAAFPPGSRWDKWLATRRPYWMVGATYTGEAPQYYRTTDIRNNFNRIIYFDTTEASRLLR